MSMNKINSKSFPIFIASILIFNLFIFHIAFTKEHQLYRFFLDFIFSSVEQRNNIETVFESKDFIHQIYPIFNYKWPGNHSNKKSSLSFNLRYPLHKSSGIGLSSSLIYFGKTETIKPDLYLPLTVKYPLINIVSVYNYKIKVFEFGIDFSCNRICTLNTDHEIQNI